MQEKIRGDEVEVEKLLIVIFINRQRHKTSLEKQRFREIYKRTEIYRRRHTRKPTTVLEYSYIRLF